MVAGRPGGDLRETQLAQGLGEVHHVHIGARVLRRLGSDLTDRPASSQQLDDVYADRRQHHEAVLRTVPNQEVLALGGHGERPDPQGRTGIDGPGHEVRSGASAQTGQAIVGPK